MEYSFTCHGHKNITAKHKTTLEFTKEYELSLRGDCIVGVKADFSIIQLKDFIKKIRNNQVTITIKPANPLKNKKNDDKIVEMIDAEINPLFNSDKEIVIRKTEFISERTFAIRANKAAFELNTALISFLKENENIAEVSIAEKK
jgi:uncharacterized protein